MENEVMMEDRFVELLSLTSKLYHTNTPIPLIQEIKEKIKETFEEMYYKVEDLQNKMLHQLIEHNKLMDNMANGEDIKVIKKSTGVYTVFFKQEF